MRLFSKWGKARTLLHSDQLMHYIVNTELDGKLSKTGDFQSSVPQLKAMIRNIISFFKAHPNEPNRIVFYCHGGLVSEHQAGDQVRAHYQTFLKNGVYPVYFVWESGIIDALEDHFHDTIDRYFRMMTPYDEFVDEMIEEAAKRFPDPWNRIKIRANHVFSGSGGGWLFFKLLVKELRKENLHAEIHLIGHSAGSRLLAYLLRHLLETKEDLSQVSFSTCTLYAPSMPTELFDTYFSRALTNGPLQRFFLYTLSDALEQEDRTVPIYHKSLLYLISRGFDAEQGPEPLLGMQIYAKNCEPFQRIIKSGQGAWVIADHVSQPSFYSYGTQTLKLISHAKQHGGFGYERDTLNSTLKVILNRNDIVEGF